VLKTVSRSLAFLTQSERAKYLTLVGLRALASLLDLMGVLAMGFLSTSIALFVIQGSIPDRVIQFAGLALPAVTAKTLPFVAVAILLLFLGKAVLAILLTRVLALFLAGIEARAARQVASAAFGKGLSDARKFSREEIYFAVQSGSPGAFNFVLNSAGTIVAEGVLFVLIIIAFFSVDPISAVGAILYFGFIALVIHLLIGRLLHSAATKNAEGIVEGNSVIGDLSEVFREATILKKKNFFLERLYFARVKAASSFASQLVLLGMPRYIVETSLLFGVAVFVLAQSASGDLVSAATTVGVFLVGGLRLTASLLPLQSALLTIKQALPQADKALDLLVDSEDHEANAKLHQDPRVSGPVSIELIHVGFLYHGSTENTLEELTLKVEPGQQIAIIGLSGSGKSTIADLIVGLLEPSKGQVLIDGRPPMLTIRETPGRIGYVPQSPGIVAGTILENIALGVPEDAVDSKLLMNAIADAHLTEVVRELPDGIHTDIGKRRDELSGGQLQRIGLARALYTEPGLLVMDEATSALDADSENEINKALDEMRGRVTVVLIAHRLNTVQRSDRVFLIEGGKISASGEFPELLKSNSTVQALAKLMSIDSAD
jgi:ABC-type bacteriocin/lantibiotic exporter with double-glycine peptidase domain